MEGHNLIAFPRLMKIMFTSGPFVPRTILGESNLEFGGRVVNHLVKE